MNRPTRIEEQEYDRSYQRKCGWLHRLVRATGPNPMNKDILPVLDEISAVLKKHDMVGLVMVGNHTHCDWRMDIEASWSCAWLEKDAQGRHLLRVRSKAADYPNRESQKQELQRTIGTFVTFSDTLVRLGENVEQVLVMLAKHVEFLGKSTTEDG